MAAIQQKGHVACVQRRRWRERWYSDVSSVTWRFVWTESVLRTTAQKELIRHVFIRLPCK